MDLFLESLKEYGTHFSFTSAIMLLMIIFMFIGAFDRIRGNKWGYGKQFEEGFNAMGPLALAMVGILALAPLIQAAIEPVIGPLYGLIGASPATLAGTLLSSDMGGYPVAMELAGDDVPMGLFSGLIIGSIMGPTITFTIPVALSMLKPADRPYISLGVMIALMTIPLGCFIGGLCMAFTPYKISAVTLLINLLPTTVIIILIMIALWRAPKATMKAFGKFGDFIMMVITIALALAVFQYLSGIKLPVVYKMVEENPQTGTSPLTGSFLIIGSIGMILLGAFPLVYFITTKLKKPLLKIGSKVSLGAEDCGGLIAALANSIPVFGSFDKMSGKGKLVNMAFVVSGAFVLGDHLGFTAGVNQEMIVPMIVGKLVAGISAIVIAWLVYDKIAPQLNCEL